MYGMLNVVKIFAFPASYESIHVALSDETRARATVSTLSHIILFSISDKTSHGSRHVILTVIVIGFEPIFSNQQTCSETRSIVI